MHVGGVAAALLDRLGGTRHQGQHALGVVARLGERAAKSTIPILITGESGVGKEVIARAVHGSSDRAGKPFVAVNCGAIPENLVESILFGHEQGAFTGVLAMLTDITERKLAERRIEESERKFRMLFASNPQPMWVYDAETLEFLTGDAKTERSVSAQFGRFE